MFTPSHDARTNCQQRNHTAFATFYAKDVRFACGIRRIFREIVQLATNPGREVSKRSLKRFRKLPMRASKACIDL